MTKSSWDPEAWSERDVRTHAYLMMAAWGFFLPVGLITQSHLRSRLSWEQRKFGNHCHMSSMTIGVILALVGFGYGHHHLTTFSRDPKYMSSYVMAHALIGTIATILMAIEVILVGLLVGTTKSQEDRYEEWPMWRKVGHASHRDLGFISLILAFVTLEAGTHISSITGRGIEKTVSTKDQD
ncbi:unnamed protein product [Cylindrotheca closterium]|uniref:Cytochrome b561 domain-containing protein n=1 Tax=Cylindrotheca closterium TaxID=2856 RepID=A0AAD2GC68_9STRA|nr:unnamed protein product [Cylindrotheca closterium]